MDEFLENEEKKEFETFFKEHEEALALISTFDKISPHERNEMECIQEMENTLAKLTKIVKHT